MAGSETDLLIAKLGATFDDIAAEIAHRLGFGPSAEMTPGLREWVNDEVRDAVDAWAAAERREPLLRPTTSLQVLLAKYRAIELEISARRRGGKPPS